MDGGEERAPEQRTADPTDPVIPGQRTAGQQSPELRTLRQKVEYMVETTFPGRRISGRVFSDLVKERGGSLSHSYFSNILAGKVTHPSEDILRALGLGFGVDWRFFKEESEIVDEVVAGLQFLVKRRTGEISGPAPHGLDDGGLPPELLKFALSLLADPKAARQQQDRQPDEAGGQPDRQPG
ncbi:hypothetical protein ACIOHE_14195 [Streptomyces sp. NPDC087851]|uniref:hypothetical protein n=1 Tax=Streptomyces sp. NPDC087851 TaxID=3365810 RepID=UPI00380C644D